LYETNYGGLHTPHLTSVNLKDWSPPAEALPTLGAWALPEAATHDRTWAPGVVRVSPTRSVLCYCSNQIKTAHEQCIGTADASAPAGPFVRDPNVLVCDSDGEGLRYHSCDPSPFVDGSGALYLLWAPGFGDPSTQKIVAQRLNAQGDALVGSRTTLVLPDRD